MSDKDYRIGEKELTHACDGHIERLGNPPGAFRELGIDGRALRSTVSAMVEVRDPTAHAKGPKVAYLAGFYDGFVLAIRALDAHFKPPVLCPGCGVQIGWEGDEFDQKFKAEKEKAIADAKAEGHDADQITISARAYCSECAQRIKALADRAGVNMRLTSGTLAEPEE